MHLPLLLATALLGAQSAAPQQAFTVPPSVGDSNRIALTPRLDGVLSPGEWDPFSSSEGVESFLQWEPRMLHVAAKLPPDQALIVSLDMKSNGWLVGKDNVEVRIQLQDGKPVVTARLLDATAVEAPQWRDLKAFAQNVRAAAKSEGSSAVIEASIDDCGLGLLPEEPGNTLTARIDAVPATAEAIPSTTPRVGAKLEVVTERAVALPVGLKWNAEETGRTVQPGDTAKIRVTFNGSNNLGLKRLALRGVGFVAETTDAIDVTFPQFDRKGRAYVDWRSPIDKNADYGYRVLQGTLSTADGSPAVLQTSFRVAPLLEFDIPKPIVRRQETARTAKVTYLLRSNIWRRVDGTLSMVLPEGWQLVGPAKQEFIVYHKNAPVRRSMDVVIPAGASGAYPVEFRAKVGAKTYSSIGWVTVE